MNIDAVIFPDDNSGDKLQGVRMPYFYLHGILEKIVGYDCCNGNIHAMQNALSVGISLVMIKSLGLGLMFTHYSHSKMEGLIVLINDLEGINDVINAYKQNGNRPGYGTLMEESEKEYYKTNYPESYNLIFKS